MKALYKIAALTAISASIIGTPVMAQDSESYVLNLNGSVASNCELVPYGQLQSPLLKETQQFLRFQLLLKRA